MKTAIDKNESEFDRMKRKAEEWLNKDRNKTAPPFLHLALRDFKEGKPEPVPVSAEEIRIKIRNIIVDYHRRDEYDLNQAQADIEFLFVQYASQFQTEQRQVTDEPYEPYHGWCDVDKCDSEASGGGLGWRETGYWSLCSKHHQMEREGKKQPKMKQSSIDREKSRDKVTGYLPSK